MHKQTLYDNGKIKLQAISLDTNAVYFQFVHGNEAHYPFTNYDMQLVNQVYFDEDATTAYVWIKPLPLSERPVYKSHTFSVGSILIDFLLDDRFEPLVHNEENFAEIGIPENYKVCLCKVLGGVRFSVYAIPLVINEKMRILPIPFEFSFI